jgi:hypothetical protein
MAGPVGIGVIRGGSSATGAMGGAALVAAWSGFCLEHKFSNSESLCTMSPPTRISEPLCEAAGKARFVVRMPEPDVPFLARMRSDILAPATKSLPAERATGTLALVR